MTFPFLHFRSSPTLFYSQTTTKICEINTNMFLWSCGLLLHELDLMPNKSSREATVDGCALLHRRARHLINYAAISGRSAPIGFARRSDSLVYRILQSIKLFVNPFHISYMPKSQRYERARILAEKLTSTTPNQLVLVPYNVGQHWMLTIIDPHKELIFFMDPISHRNRDNNWKYVVDIAMSLFITNLGKKVKKKHSWEVIKGPIQPDSKQCGYYVMQFMREIIKGLYIKSIRKLRSMKSMLSGRIA